MILFKLYFWIPFIIVAIAYITKRETNSKFVFKTVFPTYIHYVLTIFSVFFISYSYNLDHQIFCQPVLWAKIVILITLIWLLILPQIIKYHSINLIMLGLLLFISIYLIAFGSSDYLIFSLLNSIIYLPIFLLSYFLNKEYTTRKFGFLNLYGFIILFPILILIDLSYI